MNRSSIAIFIGCLMIGGSTTPGMAGQRKSAEGKTGYFSFGGGMYNVDNINNKLESAGAPDVSPYHLSAGAVSSHRYKRFIFDKGVYGTWYRAGESDSMRSSLGTIYLVNTVGFNLLSPGKLALYPYAGLGASVAGLKIHHSEQDFISFANAPRTPARLYQGTFLLDAGVGFDLQLERGPHGKKSVLGIRGGYRFDPRHSDNWYQEKMNITRGPRFDHSGPYARIVLGMQGRKYKKGHCCEKCEE